MPLKACGLFCIWLFSSQNLHRVWAACDVRNHASYRVMESWVCDGRHFFKKDVLHKGEWRDSYLYAVLAEEWDSASHA
jgi:[ribosomal protein S5]-alanine N-acetyltransferase